MRNRNRKNQKQHVDIIVEKIIYKHSFDSKLSTFKSNMFDQLQLFNEITQRLITIVVDKTIEFYIRCYSFQQNSSKFFDSQKVQNIVNAIVENDTFQ